MKLLWQAGLCCLLATGVCAQHRGGGGGFHGGAGRGGHGGGWVGRGPGYRSGGFHSSYRSPGFYGRFGGFRGRNFYSPYSYPFYFGSWWPTYSYWPDLYDDYYSPGYGSSYGYSQAPNVTVIYPQQPATSSLVMTPSYPVYAPAPRVSQEEPPAASPLAEAGNPASPIYLIAFQDHMIRAALAYWVRDDTLAYIDMEHKIRQVPLSKVDRSFSLQLNRERRVPFRLPAVPE